MKSEGRMASCIHASFIKYLLSLYCVPEPVQELDILQRISPYHLKVYILEYRTELSRLKSQGSMETKNHFLTSRV